MFSGLTSGWIGSHHFPSWPSSPGLSNSGRTSRWVVLPIPLPDRSRRLPSAGAGVPSDARETDSDRCPPLTINGIEDLGPLLPSHPAHLVLGSLSRVLLSFEGRACGCSGHASNCEWAMRRQQMELWVPRWHSEWLHDPQRSGSHRLEKVVGLSVS